MLNKITTEYRAGAHNADVVVLTEITPWAIDKKIVASPEPHVPFVRKARGRGLWPGVYAIGYTIIYNTKRVGPREVPRQYEDLLNPRWKGNMIMDAEAHDLLAGLIDLWGEKKAAHFLQQLADTQAVRFARQSHTFMTQLVAAGEHDLIVDATQCQKMKPRARRSVFVLHPTIVRTPSVIRHGARPHPAPRRSSRTIISKEASETGEEPGEVGAA